MGLSEVLHPVASMVAAAVVLAGGGVLVGWVFPVQVGIAERGDLHRVWGDTEFMVALSLWVYVPGVLLGLACLALLRRQARSVVVQERLAALTGLAVVGYLAWLTIKPLLAGPPDYDVGGLPGTMHVLHYPALGVVLCVAVGISLSPVARHVGRRSRSSDQS